MALHGVLEIIHYKALTLLLSGYTTNETAERTGVDKQTIIRWKRREDFQEMMSIAAARVFESAIAELVSTSRDAALELKRIVLSPSTPIKTKLQAISILLDNASRSKTWAMEKRLERVENMLSGTGGGYREINLIEDPVPGEEDSGIS